MKILFLKKRMVELISIFNKVLIIKIYYHLVFMIIKIITIFDTILRMPMAINTLPNGGTVLGCTGYPNCRTSGYLPRGSSLKSRKKLHFKFF